MDQDAVEFDIDCSLILDIYRELYLYRCSRGHFHSLCNKQDALSTEKDPIIRQYWEKAGAEIERCEKKYGPDFMKRLSIFQELMERGEI